MKSLKIPQQFDLEFMKPIKWSEIFAKWREYEAGQDSWKKHWEKRGFDSWDDWRQAYFTPMNPEKLEWYLYKINEPLKVFPDIYGVPSKAWIEKAYQGERTKKLKEIINLPIVSENPKVADIKNTFPKETMLTGFIVKDAIVLFEGMHRACALASWDKSIPLESEISIALAQWDQEEIPAIGGNYKNR